MKTRHPASAAVIELRKALGITQARLAALLGSAVTTVARYETSHPPSGNALLALAKIAEGHESITIRDTFGHLFADQFLAEALREPSWLKAIIRKEALRLLLEKGERQAA